MGSCTSRADEIYDIYGVFLISILSSLDFRSWLLHCPLPLMRIVMPLCRFCVVGTAMQWQAAGDAAQRLSYAQRYSLVDSREGNSCRLGGGFTHIPLFSFGANRLYPTLKHIVPLIGDESYSALCCRRFLPWEGYSHSMGALAGTALNKRNSMPDSYCFHLNPLIIS